MTEHWAWKTAKFNPVITFEVSTCLTSVPANFKTKSALELLFSSDEVVMHCKLALYCIHACFTHPFAINFPTKGLRWKCGILPPSFQVVEKPIVSMEIFSYVIEQVQIIFSLVKRVSNIENSRSKSDELAFLS